MYPLSLDPFRRSGRKQPMRRATGQLVTLLAKLAGQQAIAPGPGAARPVAAAPAAAPAALYPL
jgi:hypothetical protein